MSNIKSYSSALSGMISDYEGESRGMLSVRAGFLVSERGSQPVSLSLWAREDDQPAYGVDPVNLRAAISRPKVPTTTRVEKLELAFWDKFTGEFTLDSVVGCMYMRARSTDELHHAAYMLSRMGVNKARKTIQYIRARISDDQLYRIMNKLRLDPALSTGDNIRVYNEPRISAVHLSILSDKVKAHDTDYFWAKLRKIARIPVCGGVSGAINEVVAQAGLFGDTSWSRAIGDSLKKLAAQLKKFAECGVAGRIVIYVALGFLVSKVMDFLPWWAVVAMLTCAEIGWISDFGSEIAEVVAGGCGIDDTDIHFPAFGEPLDVWNNRYGDNGDPHVSLATSYGSLRLGSVVAQSGASYTMLTLGLTALIARRVPMYSKIINITKFKLGLEEVFKGVEGSLEALVNLVLRSFNSKNVFRFRQQSDMVGRMVDDVDKLDVLVRAKGCEIDEAMYQRFSGLVAQVEEAITQWPRDSAEWRALKKAMGVLTKLSCDYPAHFNSAKARIEPIGLMLSGDPGLGKTTLLKAITKIIAKYEFPDEPFDMAKHMFQKPTGQYYEGYKGQTVFCLDDVFTKQPVAGETDGDAETIVRLINQWPLALNMANCALKGRFYMTSPYVIATSNIKKMDGLKKAVVDEKAILRRFPLWYGVELVEGARIGPNVHPDEVWRFKAIDFSDTGNTGEYITFTQLMKKLFAERRRRIDYAKSDVVGDDYINELVDDIADEQNALSAVASIRGVTAQSGRAATTLKAVGIGACAALTVRALMRAAGHAAGSAITRMRERIARRVPEILNKVMVVGARQMAKMAVVILLMVAAFRGLKAVARGFAGLFTKNASTQKDGTIVAQAGARDEVVELVQRNMFIIYCGDVRLGFGLGIDDMTMVLPGHFVEESRRKHYSLVAIGRRGVKIVLKEIVKHDEARDVVYFRAKTMCRDLTKSHITADVRETNLLLVRPNSVVECSTTLCPKNVTYSGSPEFKPIRRSLHTHTARTDYGDCGAIIMAATGKGGRRIYGFHTAADLSERKYTGCFTTFGDAVVAQSGGTFCGHEIIRKIDKPIHNGGDTRLEPTPYSGLFGDVLTLPSAKRPSGEIDPMLKAISGYKRDWPDVPPEIPACVSAVVAEIFDALKGHDLGPVGMWEAAAGIAGEPYCKGLARGKSPGYPFIERYHDKKMMLGSDGPYVKGPAYGELEEAVRSLENTYRAGGQGAVYRDSLKDEPRKVEKVRTCATRMISGCPVELAVLGRMQTLKFTSALMQTRHEHGIMPGFNPYGIEANQLFHRLAFVNKTQTATAGDYKEFDKTQHPVAMKLIWDDISRRLVVYGCDPHILAGLGRDTFNAMHLGGNSYVSDTIYRVDGTLPSGHWMTSFLNSIYNAVIIRYCWVKYKGGLEHVYEFSRHVAAVYYGDDFVLAADDANAGFGLNKLQEFVAHMGMVMTDEDGNFGGEPYKSIFDVSFLCRKFRIAKSGVVWMPLELDSINDMFNWKKRSTPIQQHTEAIIRASLMEAAAHPIDTFVVYYKKCQALADKYVARFPELSLPLEQAYDHWKMVHKGHVPIWSDEEE